MKLVYGVGINDADYVVGNGTTVCPYYATWKRMLQRVYSTKFHVKNPSYQGLSVCAEWLRFSTFKEWMIQQPWVGMQLDKDLRQPNAKVYSPSTCAFIPSRINSLLHDCAANRGELPIGVYAASAMPLTPYRARVRGLSGVKHLGYFSTPEHAHVAWCQGKAVAIKETLEWWQIWPEVAHTFHPEIARNLAKIANQLFVKELANAY